VRACDRAQRVGACVMAGHVRTPAQQRERAAGVDARWVLCEGMRVCCGGSETDGGLRVLGRGSFGVLCSGVGADTKETTSTTRCTDEAS
jgi:hypothetical protein